MREMGAESVADVLAASSELYIRRYSGGLATLSQRGQSASSTLILLDGHRIASPSLGQLDLSLLPSLILTSVEISAGPGSAAYGSDAVGGVVHLLSGIYEDGHAQSPLRLKMSRGSYGKHLMSVAASHRRGRVVGTLATEYDASTGDYPYRNKALFPPREVPLRDAEMMHRAAFGSLSLVQANGRWSLAALYNDSERGLPAIHSTLPSQERQWDEYLRIWSHGSQRFSWGTLRMSGLAQVGALRYQNGRIKIDDTGRTFISTATIETTLTPKHRWQVGGGLEGGYGKATHPSLSKDAQERHAAAFAQATATYGPLTLYPALRQDLYLRADAQSQVALSPRLGANVRLLPGVHAKASLGRAYRVPTFNDRYWQPGGKPLLRPERSWTADAGVQTAVQSASAELTAFVSRNTDEIIWAPTQAGYWAPDNVRRRVLRGLEASLAARFGLTRRAGASAGVHYTYTSAGSAADMRLIPRNQLKGHLTLRLFTPNQACRLTLFSSIRFTGAQAISSEDTANAFVLVDNQLRLHLPLNEHTLVVGLASENTLGTRYEFLPSQPMPPRQLRLDVTLTL